ncbi:Hypothetical predicted protein [Olea europaea subsp. europaea]|uniref:Uncharacterized protein n=1 Tax=Olea europaea subsp. europaea TaxID=158383 RepID=A0A8S0RVZ0_OLEEU|nr:Hypothetical predicted protein [Olea europaea subsp. europaea]
MATVVSDHILDGCSPAIEMFANVQPTWIPVSSPGAIEDNQISIGPYHHGKQKLDAFEKLKIPVAREFVRACGNQVSIKQLYEEVAKVGESVRKCYEKGSTEEYNDESFTKMMLLDACFVLQFMSISVAKNNCANGTDMEQDEVDPLQPWSRFHFFARKDLFLLENQIPLLVLKVLVKFRFTNEIEGTMLILNFLNQKAAILPL